MFFLSFLFSGEALPVCQLRACTTLLQYQIGKTCNWIKSSYPLQSVKLVKRKKKAAHSILNLWNEPLFIYN